ncbi:MAG: hypothetical protein AAF411_15635 [Myxococcota bacterium]
MRTFAAFFPCSVLVAGSILVGCSDHVHLGENGFFAVAINEATPPALVVEDVAVFVSEQRVLFPLQAPTDAQLAELAEGADGLPWERRPWVERGDYEIEVDYLLINLEEDTSRVTFTVNGINEFEEYVPEYAVDDEDIVADFSQFERAIELEPLERRAGTIRETVLDEAAVDLATVVNGVTNANQIVHPDNQSFSDRRAMPFIPAVVPALVGLRAGLVVFGDAAGTPPNVLLEWTIRVRDDRDVIVSETQAWEMPEPLVFLPSSVVPPET